MIRVSHGAYGRVAYLECDICGETLPSGIAVPGSETPNPALRDNLREQAVRAGWAGEFMPRGRQWRDLCPDCLTMPAEA